MLKRWAVCSICLLNSALAAETKSRYTAATFATLDMDGGEPNDSDEYMIATYQVSEQEKRSAYIMAFGQYFLSGPENDQGIIALSSYLKVLAIPSMYANILDTINAAIVVLARD